MYRYSYKTSTNILLLILYRKKESSSFDHSILLSMWEVTSGITEPVLNMMPFERCIIPDRR